MRAKLVWSPRAREDLLEIYIAIGLDNPDAARDFTQQWNPKQNFWAAIPGSEFDALRFMAQRAF